VWSILGSFEYTSFPMNSTAETNEMSVDKRKLATSYKTDVFAANYSTFSFLPVPYFAFPGALRST
jgi:hypothetical protein